MAHSSPISTTQDIAVFKIIGFLFFFLSTLNNDIITIIICYFNDGVNLLAVSPSGGRTRSEALCPEDKITSFSLYCCVCRCSEGDMLREPALS